MEKYQITVMQPKTINIEDITRKETFNLSMQSVKKALWSFIEENKALREKVGSLFDMNEALHGDVSRVRSRLKYMDKEYLKLKKKYEQLLHVEEAEVPEPSASTTPVVKVTEAKAGSGCSGVHHKGGAVGIKLGKSSLYHYVYLDRARQKYRADMTIDGKRLQSMFLEDQTKAALIVDEFIDQYEDPKAKKPRPRNRDEFPEVMAAYKVAPSEATEVVKSPDKATGGSSW